MTNKIIIFLKDPPPPGELEGAMKRIKITQIKSGIDRSETVKRTLIALGLRKMNATVEVEATPQILGMVRRVNHLLKVEELSAVEG